MNATEINVPGQSPIEGTCPSWCAMHERADVGFRDEFIVHVSRKRGTTDWEIQLRQVEFVNDAERHPVFVYMNGEELPLTDAALIGAVLSATAAEASIR